MGQGLYAKTRFWDSTHNIAHLGSQDAQNPMVFPEADYLRVLGKIKGNAGSAGNCVITIKGVLYAQEVPIDTITIVANGTNTVLGHKLVDIRGFDEIRGTVTYTDTGGKNVDVDVYVGAPYKQS